MQSFAEALQNELEDTGVSITSLMPGPTDTKFFDRADMDDTKVGQGSKDDPAQVAAQGFAALMSGKDKLMAGSARTQGAGPREQGAAGQGQGGRPSADGGAGLGRVAPASGGLAPGRPR